MDNIKLFFKRNIAYFLTFFIILLFPISAYSLLVKKELITEEAFYSNLLGFAGWIIALLIAWIHIRKNREDNLIVQEKEIKKRFEIESFKEINKVMVENEEGLTDISTYYIFTWKHKIRNNIKDLNGNEIILTNNILTNIHLEAREQNTRLIELWKNFIVSIETYEIALIQFNKLREVLNNKFKEILFITNDFEKYILNLARKQSLNKETDLAELDKKMLEINNKIMDIACYLRDYRIELMNSMLGDIFHSEVPKRKAKEPNKTLTQIAKDLYKDS
jgi:hypothetical protein